MASVMVRLRNSRSGMIGSAARDSTTTNATSASTPPPTISAVWPGHPGELVAGEGDPDQQHADAGGEEDRAEVVDLTPCRLTTGRCRVRCSTTSATTANGTPT